MMADGARPEPLFIDGPAGALFCVHYAPRPQAASLAPAGGERAVLYLPPFAEEMNRSRRLVALQARALARAGVGVLVLDHSGTGDSAGDFERARWSTWSAEGLAGLEWLSARGYRKTTLLGLRLGACLALGIAAQGDPRVERAVLWQPVLDGETYLKQFLRVRLAAAMLQQGEWETTAGLLQRLRSGETLEVAGYALPGMLAGEIAALRLSEIGVHCRVPLDWVAVTPGQDGALAPAALRAVESWRQQGVAVSTRCLTGPPFWSIEEPTSVAGLSEATVELCTGGAA